jgi:hypothetical protein
LEIAVNQQIRWVALSLNPTKQKMAKVLSLLNNADFKKLPFIFAKSSS